MPAAVDASTDYLPEPEFVTAATAAGTEVGAPALSPAVGSLLRFLAGSLRAQHVVEIGTGTGVGGLWILEGMGSTGTLTTIDTEAELHRIARTMFNGAGYATNRVRLITGRARDVLPRLADGAYDMVWCRAGRTDYPFYLGESVRMLRPGGMLVLHDAVGRSTDPAARDAESVALRELRQALLAEERLTPAVLPGSEGILLALRGPDLS